MDYIQSLRQAIKRLHGCDSTYLESVPIEETFQGKTVWKGIVEVFELTGHPKAKRCYAWSHIDGPKDADRRFMAVLELPPVDSPRKAVQAAIVSQSKKR